MLGPDGPRELNFKIYPLGSAAPREPGVFIYATRTATGDWRALYIGETSDLRARLAFNEIVADAILFGATDVHILTMRETPEYRREVVDQLVATNAPPLNGDERKHVMELLASTDEAPPPPKTQRRA